MRRVSWLIITTLVSVVPAAALTETDLHPQVRFDFGIASYAFRARPLAAVIDCARRTGVRKLALKDVHLPLDSSSAQVAQVVARIRAAGLEPYAGGVIYMKSPAEVRRAFAYAQAAGMSLIVGVPEPNLLDLAEAQVRATGIRLAIHIHGDRAQRYPDAASVFALIRERDPRVGICLDVGHSLRLNEDPAAQVRRYRERILDVQLWDCSSASYEGRAVLAGTGVMDLPDLMRALVEVGYAGTVAVAFWTDPQTPEFGTAQTLGYCQGILAALPRMDPAPNTLSEAERAAGWHLLFDGHSTRGWRGINQPAFPAQGWEVTDGELRVLASGGGQSQWGGAIVTTETFGRFELSWEWKMLTRGGNSGLKYFVLEGLGSNAKSGIGLEYQILDDANHAWMLAGKMKPGDDHTTGALYELYAPTDKRLRPLGTWNRSRIVCDGTHVEHWLNGRRVVSFERGSADFRARVQASKFKGIPGFGEAESGHLLLQDHGGEVHFRNLKIRTP